MTALRSQLYPLSCGNYPNLMAVPHILKTLMKISFPQLMVYAALLLVGGSIGVVGSRYWPKSSATPAQIQPPSAKLVPPAAPDPETTDPDIGQLRNPNFIAEAVDRIGPAVVRIDATVTVAADVPEAFQSPIFRRFFGDVSEQPQLEHGTGSGFILSEDGRILTNAHVVKGATEVIVRLKDGRELKGKVLGSDPLTDVAVVKVEATGLPIAELGASQNLVPGQWAIAIGNPLGLDYTVTVGIVSAIDRSSAQVGVGDEQRVRFIQTDAAINPGNSGGPLLNDRGEVIGINTVIRANAQGLGFAIPIETAERVANQIVTKGRAEHPYLGVQMVDLTAAVRDQLNKSGQFDFKVDRDTGTFVVRVMPDSPADRAGLQAGDLIQSIDGATIHNAADVQQQVEAREIGATLQVVVQRKGKVKTLSIRTQAFPVRDSNEALKS
jgi:S1-C subfamily serine protease